MPTPDQIAAVLHATATGGAPACFAAVDALAATLFDHRLFTVTRSLHATREVERAYSSNPAAYPVGGRKHKAGTLWGERVLDCGEMLVCHGADDIRATFADHALILSLGIGGMVNVPVLFAGRSLATMNVSHAGDRFGAADRPALSLLAGLLLPAVMTEGE